MIFCSDKLILLYFLFFFIYIYIANVLMKFHIQFFKEKRYIMYQRIALYLDINRNDGQRSNNG
jgi:hypothetical protein